MAVQPGGYLDRPEDDNTHNAHPAWKRGKIAGILETLAIFKNVITGADDGSGTINSPEIEKIRRSIVIMREALQKSGKQGTSAKVLDEAAKVAHTLRYQKK
tara:strand:+ start:724 stop:1026 length:303 start_codon:yes stop_codon:yes gene_type:complete